MIQPGMLAPNSLANLPSTCGAGCGPVWGWMGGVVSVLASQRRFAMSFDAENQLIIASTQPLTLGYSTPQALIQASSLAVQGQSAKNLNQAVWAAANLVVPCLATTTPVFGLRIRISNSVLNFKFGAYTLNFVNAASTVPVVQATITAQVRKLPLDIVFLSISNAGGIATVVPAIDAGVQLLLASNPALVAGDVIYAESLNAHDLGDIINPAAAVSGSE
jgi:hypothetical protein